MKLVSQIPPGVASLILVVLVALLFLAPFLLFLRRRALGATAMLGLVLSLFGVVIAANLTMAVTALRSFPGLEVANSYVASQQFDRARAAQQALGWQVAPVYDGQALTLAIRDAQGLPAALSDLSVTIGRPTQSRDDRSLEMRGAGGVWRAEVDLPPGAWVLHVAARAPDGTDFRQRLSGFPGSMVAR